MWLWFLKVIFLFSLKHTLIKWPLFLQYVQVESDPTPEDTSERPDIGRDIEPILSGDWELDVLEDLDSETFFLFESEPFNEQLLWFWTKNVSYEKEYNYLK
jgi:hypothetical protein